MQINPRNVQYRLFQLLQQRSPARFANCRPLRRMPGTMMQHTMRGAPAMDAAGRKVGSTSILRGGDLCYSKPSLTTAIIGLGVYLQAPVLPAAPSMRPQRTSRCVFGQSSSWKVQLRSAGENLPAQFYWLWQAQADGRCIHPSCLFSRDGLQACRCPCVCQAG
jgi:hypothetical protein